MHKSRKKKEEHELKQWTQEDIREAIESFYAQHHRYPRAGECKSKNGLPTYNTIRAVFQMTAADYLKTFFSQTPREFWTKESVLQAIYQFIQEKGAFPMSKDYCSQNGLPASATVYKLFPGETLRNIYMQYFPEQIQGNYQMQSWTKESIIQALDEYLKRTGQLPGCRDFYRKNHLPTMYSIRKVFGHNSLSAIYRQCFGQSIPPAKRFWDQHTVLESVYEKKKKNGKFPNSVDFNNLNQLPSLRTVHKLFPGMTFRDFCEKYFNADTPEAEDMETSENFGLSMGGM